MYDEVVFIFKIDFLIGVFVIKYNVVSLNSYQVVVFIRINCYNFIMLWFFFGCIWDNDVIFSGFFCSCRFNYYLVVDGFYRMNEFDYILLLDFNQVLFIIICYEQYIMC